jgi:hypothetical protein
MRSSIATALLIATCCCVHADLDRFCWRQDQCRFLRIEDGKVVFVDPRRQLALGEYVAADQAFVPPLEAPIRDLSLPSGGRVVISAFLDHTNTSEVGLHVRFFSSKGKVRGSQTVLMMLIQGTAGRLFGGTDDIVAVTSQEEHSYNTRTDIWLVPVKGSIRNLLSAYGDYEEFRREGGNRPPGVWVNVEMYDGVHASTKGQRLRFYRWDSARKRLLLTTK